MTIYRLHVFFFQFEPIHCSMSSFNCCFFTCIQVSQEKGKVVWYSYLFKNFHSLLWSKVKGKPFNITVIRVYAPTSNAEEAEVERFYEDLQDILDLITQNRCSFHHRGLECKSRKSRDTWSNKQVWPQSTKWSRAKANRVLLRECTGHSKHPRPTIQGWLYT